MSSIASPTTTMRCDTILRSRVSRRSRGSRVSVVRGVMKPPGEGGGGGGPRGCAPESPPPRESTTPPPPRRSLPRTTPHSLRRLASRNPPLAPEPIAHAYRPDEVGAAVSHQVLEVGDVVYSGIEPEAKLAARRVAAGQRRAQRALHHALKDGGRRGARRFGWGLEPWVALALPQEGQLRGHEQTGVGEQGHLQRRLVVVVEVAAGAEEMIQRHLEVVLVAVGEIGDPRVEQDPGERRGPEPTLRADGEGVA